MQCANQTKSACIPITALCVIQHDDLPVLLAGHGPDLRVYDLITNIEISSTRVFEVQAIHDIVVAPYGCHDEAKTPRKVIVAGGSSVAVLDIYPSNNWLIKRKRTLHTSDWILSTKFYKSIKDSDSFTLLTANNNLRQLTISIRSDAETNIRRIAQGPKSFLYAGDIAIVNPENFIIAGGSAFGEVLVWTCCRDDATSSWIATPIHRFDAHNGSIFGIRISEPVLVGGKPARMIASCSDDRQIQIRQIGDDDDPMSRPDALETMNTGFGHRINSDEVLAAVWGHQSRIWDIDFAQVLEGRDSTLVRLLSRGEDATCQTWRLKLTREDTTSNLIGDLRADSADRHHAGKNVWSSAHHATCENTILVSGGADGKLVKRLLPNIKDQRRNGEYSVPFANIPLALSSKALKDYTIVELDRVLATTSSGDLLCFDYASESQESWQRLELLSGSRADKLCQDSANDMAFLTVGCTLAPCSPISENSVGEALHFNHAIANVRLVAAHAAESTSDTALFLFMTFMANETPSFVNVDATTGILHLVSTRKIELPRGFVVTASCFHVVKSILILGSRAGTLLFFDVHESVSERVEAVTHIRGVHSTDTVTSVQFVPHESTVEVNDLNYLLTTGRDGTFALHEIGFTKSSGLWLRTVHRSTPPFGPNIEGAYIDHGTGELTLHCFRSTHFVVWNETKQVSIASIDCGGAHRSWAYKHHLGGRGTFVWTKAGSFNMVRIGTNRAEVLRGGGHGREIKALAVSPSPLSSSQFGSCDLVATGAEDTEIRLSAVTDSVDSATSELRCLAVLRDHTTGPQHLCFSTDGKYLVSSGGCEQLYIWRLTYGVPCVEVGVVLQDKMPRADDDADVRIMHFEILDPIAFPVQVDLDMSIAAAYSNGKVKLMHYQAGARPGEGDFQFLREVRFGAFCLTHVEINSFGREKESLMVTAGTNGYLNFSSAISEQVASNDPEKLHVHKVHQNSVQAVETLRVRENLRLMLTGGDDNALGLTILQEDSLFDLESRTLLVPKAHAAALTALFIASTWVTGDAHSAVIVTAGNDQRIKVWKLEVPIMPEEEKSIDEIIDVIRVRKVSESWTCVADVSSIGLLRSEWNNDGEMSGEVMVVGIGMEILKLDFGCAFK